MFSLPFLDLPALGLVAGEVTLPGSKSISNRVLLLAALCEGETVVHDLLASDDTDVMLRAMAQLGCALKHEDSRLSVRGLGRADGAWAQLPAAKLFLGNAGTAMRPLAAALAMLGGDFELSGVARMHERPIGDLVDALKAMGCAVDYLGEVGYPPLRIGAARVHITAPIAVRGDVSSQFLTALLLSLPLVAAQDVVVEVVGELISKPYVDITLKLLATFGVVVQQEGWQRFVIPAGSRYTSPGEVWVEGDASSASYFVALGGLGGVPTDKLSTGLTVHGVGSRSMQGDIRFVDAARQMGVDVTLFDNHLHCQRGAWPLNAIDLDCNHIPDAAMTLAVMALFAQGTTTLRNIASWRVKETDRIHAMATELVKLGATVAQGADWISITPPATLGHWRAASIHTYDDHRMAMCFSLAAFNPAGVAVRIEDPKCVAKTFPDYFETLFDVAKARGGVPVICIDGPSASGKGTLAARVAHALGYHYLDSGALYRATAVAASQAGIALSDATAVAALALHLPISFDGDAVLLNDDDVSERIRAEGAGMAASQVSAHPLVRDALLALQLRFAKAPGLVADGRDMGSVVFPGAQLKVFLTASAQTRAQRRHKQLISKGFSANIEDLQKDLMARDARDTQRAVAPLKPAEGALLLDNSALSIDESVAQVLSWWQKTRPF